MDVEFVRAVQMQDVLDIAWKHAIDSDSTCHDPSYNIMIVSTDRGVVVYNESIDGPCDGLCKESSEDYSCCESIPLSEIVAVNITSTAFFDVHVKYSHGDSHGAPFHLSGTGLIGAPSAPGMFVLKSQQRSSWHFSWTVSDSNGMACRTQTLSADSAILTM
jgi:hypothetical protein